MLTNKPFVESLNEDTEHQPLLNGVPQTGGMRSGKVYLAPGADCGEHTTGANEEMLIFLFGTGEAIINNKEKLNVGEGKVTYIPPETVHNIRNNSDKPLCYIYCVAPAGANSFDKLRTSGGK
ncbi:MAG: cupin domain-containing protein [Sedimentisphaerales bacterium]|nr:cupin domain-containing protein [Sedimentisphaerales bacterium]